MYKKSTISMTLFMPPRSHKNPAIPLQYLTLFNEILANIKFCKLSKTGFRSIDCGLNRHKKATKKENYRVFNVLPRRLCVCCVLDINTSLKFTLVIRNGCVRTLLQNIRLWSTMVRSSIGSHIQHMRGGNSTR